MREQRKRRVRWNDARGRNGEEEEEDSAASAAASRSGTSFVHPSAASSPQPPPLTLPASPTLPTPDGDGFSVHPYKSEAVQQLLYDQTGMVEM